jgi:DNA replication protein DnaD
MSKDKGFIKVYRDIREHWLWESKPFSKGQAFIDLLLRAGYKENKFMYNSQLCKTEKGEFTTSILKLSEDWGWSRYKVKTFLELLQNSQIISHKTDSKKTIVKVLNYADYQGIENSKFTTNFTTKQHQNNIKTTSNQHQNDTNKKDKERIKKVKESKEENSAFADCENEKPWYEPGHKDF